MNSKSYSIPDERYCVFQERRKGKLELEERKKKEESHPTTPFDREMWGLANKPGAALLAVFTGQATRS
jgi:hypothetical protein